MDDLSEVNTTINPAARHQAKHCDIPIYFTATHSRTWGEEAKGDQKNTINMASVIFSDPNLLELNSILAPQTTRYDS